jgi:myo-inositol 2-dehydrogenase/D-chiro-inositol 1-dehydrogenase
LVEYGARKIFTTIFAKIFNCTGANIVAVRIGFIGTGGIASHHFTQLEKIKDAQLVAFADMNTERAEAAARRFEGTAYSDARKMLEAETLDAVYVCLPPHVHGNAEILAAQKGCALFVEKPLANTMKTAEKIMQTVEDAKVLTSVGYHFRYTGAADRALQLLSGKKAPQAAMCYGRWLGGFPGVPWWRRMDQSGGQLVEQATHVVDLARYLMGEITSVSCMAALREMDKVYEGTTVPDVTALTVTFASGAIGHFATTSILRHAGENALDLYLLDATYKISGNTLEVADKEATHTYRFNNNPSLDEDKAFVQAVKTGKRTGIRSTYADALKTLKVTLAANQSAKTGKVVKV